MTGHCRRGLSAMAGVAALLVVTGGCRRPLPPVEVKTPIDRTVATTRVLVSWQEPGAGGQAVPVLEVEAESGTVEQASQSGTFERARGRIYREGVLRARFEAPIMEADQASNTATARGRVVVTSVEPAGLTVRADRVVWKASENSIIATGRVTFRQVDPATGRELAAGGPFPKVTFDTGLQKLTIP